MNLEEGFLKDSIKRLKYYKELGDKTFEQLEEQDFFYRPNEESNSIAIIVQHLYGNMLSRFTNFLTEDGEKEWRQRDAEFDVFDITKEDVLSFWNSGWNCVFTTLESLKPADLLKTIYIRTEPLLVYDAILRQLAHYPHHVGQILYIGKMLKGKDWQTLSIPKGGSQVFNAKMADTQKK
ncbi:DUF1572 domain-containing protein [Panacibacter ginsenosidivorans]|uniref:DUF1572 domain-containing protein n=1 Tax=Panacibacter ginsenosidivorans TaxID=1813871 RepID=A0A5B8VAP8_9BACT|nr:DUF1572 family protein [Panacibacter ginsenosidivorans]QEC68514.1 DUF1572 domain-containing protein [Panacibacter ginsenosidivorans]